MVEHDGCDGCKYELETPHSQHCQYCTQNAIDKYTRATNADNIRNMTDEELACFLAYGVDCDFCEGIECKNHEGNCIDGLVNWLKQEWNGVKYDRKGAVNKHGGE